jgi:hypothetical protein
VPEIYRCNLGSKGKTLTAMSPGRLKSSGDEVSTPTNTPETDKSYEIVRQKDESRLESIDEYEAERRSGINLDPTVR